MMGIARMFCKMFSGRSCFLSPDREQMKFTNESDRERISIASHAQANATLLNHATSREMRQSAGALKELVDKIWEKSREHPRQSGH